jgi:hypothetical protein
MTKNRKIFYLVFAIFQVVAFIFTLYIEDFSFLTKIYKYIGWFKYITFFGIMLVVTDAVWTWIVSRDTQKEHGALTHELNTLKAKLFDLQEVARKSEATKNPPTV